MMEIAVNVDENCYIVGVIFKNLPTLNIMFDALAAVASRYTASSPPN
jgi:hypothetical protein